MATVNADGTLISIFMTGPFGETLPNQTTPQNATTDTSYNYVGTHQKMTESSLAINPIQMGARVYIPGLGRFLQVDPVEGGTLNSYVYAHDPVNGNDISGMFFGFDDIAFGVAFLVIASVALVTTVFVTNPKIQAAAHNVAVGISTAINQAISSVRAEAKTTTKTAVKTNTRNGCSSYTPAAGYPGVKYPKSSSTNSQQKMTAINITVAKLTAGISPGGFPIFGSSYYLKDFTKNPLFMTGGWVKYSIPYPVSNFEIHYSLNQNSCQYADVKDTGLFNY